jgi:hypothetical protein
LCKETKAVIESERLGNKNPTITTHANEDPGKEYQEAAHSDQLKTTIFSHDDLFRKTNIEKRSGRMGMW